MSLYVYFENFILVSIYNGLTHFWANSLVDLAIDCAINVYLRRLLIIVPIS